MEIKPNKLSHLDPSSNPVMVDVSEKPVTARRAEAVTEVLFPSDAWQVLKENGFITSKGAILDVARVAGTMAVKKTSELIPFCHPLPIDSCSFSMDTGTEGSISIHCIVSATARTGVEMEALTGVTVAALALYDMTKSLGLGITIRNARILSKSGGKSDFKA